ncbi:EscU/YscU/HrcU family type III secretion system export apparatus switch protein [Falsiroseomonas sp. CW058]|uniref:EscU/YscU/HrcU family type III secretion system export apparatus switch protein n=1 Tax=Falsiroseomonas sp. CW058 TaxID=3388664 RepID=UPI003D31FC80
MAEEAPDAEDRTEAASPQRLEKARRDGDVALSREAVQMASLGGAALGLAMLAPSSGLALAQASQELFAAASARLPGEAAAELLRAAAPAAIGVAGLAAAGAVAATLLQTRFLVSGKALVPDPSKVSPLAGAKRLFGTHGIEELARSLVKLGVVGVALWSGAGDLAGLAATLGQGAEQLTGTVAARLGSLFSAALAATAGVAALDLLWVRLRHARKLRMSRQELKDELKENEGDPHLRAHRRAMARRRSGRRTLAATATATVVVTNPTHYAVALAYERGKDAAPRIVAKGVDALAAKMRAAAAEHGIPIVPNPPLARALYRLDEDTAIPEEHFKAVAEIIAFVWKLRNPAPPPG